MHGRMYDKTKMSVDIFFRSYLGRGGITSTEEAIFFFFFFFFGVFYLFGDNGPVTGTSLERGG